MIEFPVVGHFCQEDTPEQLAGYADSPTKCLQISSARRLKRKHRGYGDTIFIEVFVKINGKQHYLSGETVLTPQTSHVRFDRGEQQLPT